MRLAVEAVVSDQDRFWSGGQGDAYLARNRVDWPARIPFWRDVLERTGAHSVLEVGCNFGANLLALRSLDRDLQLCGVDLNSMAVDEARMHGLDARVGGAASVGLFFPREFDLVATCGVLIHVSPAALRQAMTSITMASRRYVLAVEYAADAEEAIEYRGEKDRLWKRPFGRLYEHLGLKVIDERDAGPGFDRCRAWLMER